MKERIKHSGSTAREEMIIDGQNLLKEELEHDSSYSPTMYFWNPVLGCDDRPAKVRIYKRKYSSLNGNYQNFLTTYDNPIKIGEYLHDTKDDTYWLIYNSFNVNDVHYEGKMIQCNYLLKWQLANGEIIERYSNIVSASKYDVGETGNSTLVLSSNNYTILIGYCEEGFELEGKRVFIDMKPTKPTKVFKITRSDDVLYNSGNMGSLLSFIADKTEFNPNDDNQELRICDYNKNTTPLPPTPPEPDETTDLRCVISGNTNLKNGYKRPYIVKFTDKNKNDISWRDVDFKWNIVGDLGLVVNSYENKIDLLVDNEDLIGSSFLLQIIIIGKVLAEFEITIIE
ncbi:hypothetical protein [Roseburia sp. 1XD42-69]|uniref:hypothetical protein n=1 Tax=Roseburia sp. 1XD42-69 TaxID=2320088 RepID=UPI0011C47A3E|nr:hypothetical protein [Roseburia sp. 1XD42-69]